MSTSFAQMIQIMQYGGVIAIVVSLASLFYKLIAYREDADKRVILMQGTTRLFIGILIIGSISSIVGFLFHYINAIGIQGISNSLGSPADLGKIFKPKGFADSTSSILSRLIASFLSTLTESLTKLFGLFTINQLVFQNAVKVFSDAQWNAISALYGMMILPTFILMAIMVFKTGLTYVISAANPTKGTEAKENLYRWILVILMITGGLIICRFVIEVGNLLTTALVKSTSPYMPKFPLGNDINLNSALLTTLAQLYMLYITITVNVLYIIRNIVLFVFIVFTPIVAVMWGINKRVNAIGVWLGELISNAFMGFCMAFVFTVFGVLLNITVSTTNWKEGYLLLFVLVGLSTTLKMVSVLRNSVQSLFTRLSGLDEDKIANGSSIGGMIAGVMGMRGTYRTSKILGKDIKDGATNFGRNVVKTGSGVKTGVGLGLDKVVKTRKNGNSFSNNMAGTPGANDKGIKARLQRFKGGFDNLNGARASVMDANTNDLHDGVNDNNATDTGLNKNGIRNMAIDEIKNIEGGKAPKNKGEARNLGETSYRKMLDNIQNNYDEGVKSQMPKGLSPAGRKAWLDNKAENDLAQSLGYEKPNQSIIEQDSDGIAREYFANNRDMLSDAQINKLNSKISQNDNTDFNNAINAYKNGKTSAIRGHIIRTNSDKTFNPGSSSFNKDNSSTDNPFNTDSSSTDNPIASNNAPNNKKNIENESNKFD
ncbi:hypothetical protein [Clostridium thermobutyricum]|uniref:hypothetical protein n=1 Tax=Clostridium thermobutyricum TaxID=29372 RepID=UPI0018A9FDDB|nr:hypothetical protein [Clostridium thermobutyricum]